MLQKEGGIKTKIFMAAVLIFLVSMLGMYIYNLISVNKEFAKEKSASSTECLNLRFEIFSSKLVNSDLQIGVSNSPLSTHEINSFSIVLGNETITKEVDILPSKKGTITFNNKTLEDGQILGFANNCRNYMARIAVE